MQIVHPQSVGYVAGKGLCAVRFYTSSGLEIATRRREKAVNDFNC